MLNFMCILGPKRHTPRNEKQTLTMGGFTPCQSESKNQNQRGHNQRLFADNAGFDTHKVEELQHLLDRLSVACKQGRLKGKRGPRACFFSGLPSKAKI